MSRDAPWLSRRPSAPASSISEDSNFNRTKRQRIRLSRIDAGGPGVSLTRRVLA